VRRGFALNHPLDTNGAEPSGDGKRAKSAPGATVK
jgi:hypothetical protein